MVEVQRDPPSINFTLRLPRTVSRRSDALCNTHFSHVRAVDVPSTRCWRSRAAAAAAAAAAARSVFKKQDAINQLRYCI
jgi:hypothetical protein